MLLDNLIERLGLRIAEELALVVGEKLRW